MRPAIPGGSRRDRDPGIETGPAPSSALALLCSEDEARRRTIAEAVSRRVLWAAPSDRDVRIDIRGHRVSVAFEPRAGA